MPIMQARAQPLTARKSLPKINPQLVANCKASNSRFGQPGLLPSQALAQPLPAPPTPSGFGDPIGNPPPAYGGPRQAVPAPGPNPPLTLPPPTPPEKRGGPAAL